MTLNEMREIHGFPALEAEIDSRMEAAAQAAFLESRRLKASKRLAWVAPTQVVLGIIAGAEITRLTLWAMGY